MKKSKATEALGVATDIAAIKAATHKSEQEGIMTYLERLNPWCIIRPFPDMRSLTVGRFRRRVDAEGHLQILKQMMPSVPFEIAFDATSAELETCGQQSQK